MLDPRDFSILTIDCRKMLPIVNHEDLHYKLYKKHISFKRQCEYYYQWYADYVETKSMKKDDFKRFYKVNNLHETMLTR